MAYFYNISLCDTGLKTKKRNKDRKWMATIKEAQGIFLEILLPSC